MRFQNGSNKVAIELRVVQFWSEIILVISDQIALHSVQLPLLKITLNTKQNSKKHLYGRKSYNIWLIFNPGLVLTGF